MTQKKAPTPPSPSAPRAKALARRPDVLSQRILEFLADAPALTAASVLSNMLNDSSDPATRLAILTARIEVLRARIIACRLGRPVDSAITLGIVLREQGLMDLPPEILNPNLYADLQEPSESSMTDHAKVDPLLQMRLLKAYHHEGIDLPEGAIFTIRKSLADNLLERGISEVVADDDSKAGDMHTNSKNEDDEEQICSQKTHNPT